MKQKINLFVDYTNERSEINYFVELLSNHFEIEIFPTTESSIKEKFYNVLFNIFLIERRPYLEKLKLKVRKINSKNLVWDILRFLIFSINSISVGFFENKLLSFLIRKQRQFGGINIFFSLPKSRYKIYCASVSSVKNFLFLYSWDHYLKDKNLNHLNFRYFVWNELALNELSKFHKINKSQISIVGSTLLAYLHDHKNKSVKCNGQILVHSSWADKDFIDWEMELVKKLVQLNYSIVFRLYPNCSEEQIRYILTKLEKFKNKVFVEMPNIDKLKSICESQFIFHAGSTIGIESTILNPNTIFFQPTEWYKGKIFFKQIKYHNNLRHIETFINLENANVINNFENLSEKLNLINYNSNYQTSLKKVFPVFSMEEIVNKIYHKISENIDA